MDLDLCSIAPSAKSLAYLNGSLKRYVDILGALIGIVLGMPIFCIAALVVKYVDKVPMLFFQKRVGLRGQSFTIVKLRTLIIDEKHITKPETIHQKPSYATTPTGKFLRVTSIDEIVQFFIVLKGEMSLIGHRPIPHYYLPHLSQMNDMNATKTDHYLTAIYQYKPGMSSLRVRKNIISLTFRHCERSEAIFYARNRDCFVASLLAMTEVINLQTLSSVKGRGDLTLQQKFMYDLMYARDANFLYDMKLLLQTLYVVASRQGAK